MPLMARFEVALPEGLNRGQAGQSDNETGRAESDGGAELFTEAVGEFTQDALGCGARSSPLLIAAKYCPELRVVLRNV
jgi:hypothetical protein